MAFYDYFIPGDAFPTANTATPPSPDPVPASTIVVQLAGVALVLSAAAVVNYTCIGFALLKSVGSPVPFRSLQAWTSRAWSLSFAVLRSPASVALAFLLLEELTTDPFVKRLFGLLVLAVAKGREFLQCSRVLWHSGCAAPLLLGFAGSAAVDTQVACPDPCVDEAARAAKKARALPSCTAVANERAPLLPADLSIHFDSTHADVEASPKACCGDLPPPSDTCDFTTTLLSSPASVSIPLSAAPLHHTQPTLFDSSSPEPPATSAALVAPPSKKNLSLSIGSFAASDACLENEPRAPRARAAPLGLPRFPSIPSLGTDAPHYEPLAPRAREDRVLPKAAPCLNAELIANPVILTPAKSKQPAGVPLSRPSDTTRRKKMIMQLRVDTALAADLDDHESPKQSEQYSHYDKILSLVCERIYLASETVAQDRQLLKKHGITHILNCAGQLCPNKHPGDFMYKTFHIADSSKEDIRSLFYESIEFIQDALAMDNTAVLIHCQRGVSRSAAMTIAYLMYNNKWSYEVAFKRVKEMRPVISPNAGFIFQLMDWQLTLHTYGRTPRTPTSPSFCRLIEITPHRSDPNYTCSYDVPVPDAATCWAALDQAKCYVLAMSQSIYVYKGDRAVCYQRFVNQLQRFESRFNKAVLAQLDRDSFQQKVWSVLGFGDPQHALPVE